MSKYKYYFRKPKSEIVKDIFGSLLIAGAVTIAATSPYFIANLLKSYKKFKKYPKLRITDTFARLKREGLIKTRWENKQIHIELTADGKKKAGIYQIGSLKINNSKKWDGRWRIIIFDIAELKKGHREAFRGKLKELGFLIIQKSVLIHPFSCQDEIALLRDFFGLNEDNIRLITAEKIENDAGFKKFFGLNK